MFFSTSLWALFCIAAALIWFVFNRKLTGDLLSPFNFLFFGWFGPLLLRGFNLSVLERSWSSEAQLAVFASSVFLLVPCILSRRHPGFGSAEVKRGWDFDLLPVLNNKRFGQVLMITFAFGVSAYVYNEFVRNPVGVPFFSYLSDSTLPRAAYHQFGKTRETRSWGLYFSLPLYLESAMLYMMGRVRPNRDKIWWLALSALYPLLTILKLSRTDFVQVLVPFIMVEYYFAKFGVSKSKRNWSPVQLLKRYPYISFAVVLLFSVALLLESQYEILRNGQQGTDSFQRVVGTDIDIGFDSINTFLAQTYSYTAMPWENFVSTIENYRTEFRPGVGMLRPLFAVMGQGSAVDNLLYSIDFDPYNYTGLSYLGPINTYPFITTLYLEFGVPEMLVGSFVYALLVCTLYARFRRKPNFLNVCLYLHMPFAWMWLFSTAGFTGLHIYLNILFVWALSWIYRTWCAPLPRMRSLPVTVPRPVVLTPVRSTSMRFAAAKSSDPGLNETSV